MQVYECICTYNYKYQCTWSQTWLTNTLQNYQQLLPHFCWLYKQFWDLLMAHLIECCSLQFICVIDVKDFGLGTKLHSFCVSFSLLFHINDNVNRPERAITYKLVNTFVVPFTCKNRYTHMRTNCELTSICLWGSTYQGIIIYYLLFHKILRGPISRLVFGDGCCDCSFYVV